ncbi:DUF4142 domain-containing protein [Rhodomicrobium sp. Az07]|uniref:DUF4142 domain-containing protein n=1 Tax=Rhodomicrobium sp. Az07 TaxID=2839034 RepID=UPI001BE5DEF5|nr:DUF4142 domain-containing protein [Rhodomicrobium sp. Az07]MBT3072137.1 DUF4142 domain-containing protein [Rhodomicrobium sp. Az07]
MRRFLIAVAALLTAASFAAPSFAQLATPKLSPAQTFVRDLSSAGQFEIQSSYIALQKTDNEDVRQFARKMVEDHSAADAKLKDTLKQANIKEPTVTIDERRMQELDYLKVADRDFDRQYIQQQRKAHRDTVKLLENYIQRGDNAELKQFATNLLPTIKQHLEMADNLKPKESARR